MITAARVPRAAEKAAARVPLAAEKDMATMMMMMMVM